MVDDTNISSREKLQIHQALVLKDELVTKILAQDLQILSCIEKAKSDIIRELQSVGKSRKLVNAYRNPVRPNRLDEEA